MGGGGIFARALVGAFFGKLAAALFVVVCALLGFGPNEWAKFIVTGLPPWVTPERAQTVFITLAAITFVVLSWPLWACLANLFTQWIRPRKEPYLNAGEIEILHLILWIERHSAWWRWKIAQGVIGPNKWANYNAAAGELYDQAKTGELTISARQKNKIERENVSKDFWQLAILEVKRDRLFWRVIVQPCNDLAAELGYVELRAKWEEAHKLWPDNDRELDRLIKNLLKQANTT
jgi:hypothetical protein